MFWNQNAYCNSIAYYFTFNLRYGQHNSLLFLTLETALFLVLKSKTFQYCLGNRQLNIWVVVETIHWIALHDWVTFFSHLLNDSNPSHVSDSDSESDHCWRRGRVKFTLNMSGASSDGSCRQFSTLNGKCTICWKLACGILSILVCPRIWISLDGSVKICDSHVVCMITAYLIKKYIVFTTHGCPRGFSMWSWYNPIDWWS